jgi:hypothetical protein
MFGLMMNDGLHARLTSFLDDWERVKNANTVVERLKSFLVIAHPLLAPNMDGPTPKPADCDKLRSLLPRLSASLRSASSSIGSINPWAIAGLRRREVRNAAALAALWSPRQCGQVAVAFLDKFLRLVDQPGTSLPTFSELAAGYVIRTEHSPAGDGRDRVDLVIESTDHLIGIEIKIDAGEGPAQLSRYVASIRGNAQNLGKRPVVVLLAPFAPSHPDVLRAAWSHVRAAAAAALPRRRLDYTFTHHLVAAFARHARGF